MAQSFDVVVIGAGPGGYVAAIRSAQLGFKTAVIEREFLGGVCLNVGCIPSKAMITATHLLHKAQHNFKDMGLMIKGDINVDMKQLVKWKQSVSDKMSSGVGQLLKGYGVTHIKGDAEFKSSKEISVKSSAGTESITAKYFIVATGSRPIEIPGFKFDEKDICSSTGALAFDEIPKRVAVIGGGYIGLEISSYLRKLGTEVTVIEAMPSLLAGVVDPDCANIVVRKLDKAGVKIMYGAKAKSQKKAKDGYEVTVEINGKDEVVKCDKILVTVGRRPNGDQANLKAAGIAVDERGFVKVDAQRRTNVPNIFAIGDICGQPMLAHKASHEGVLVAEVISGANRVYDAKTVPAVVFTDPEIASAGMTEAEAKAKGHTELKIGKFPFGANGRAVSMMETEGFVKMIADAKTHVLLGVHIVGPEASNLISEAVLAIEMGARIEDLALSIHPHPTLGETIMECAEATLGHAIHIIQKPLKK
ncbi:dihydrolipoyl dehydrogenase [Bdellovibrio sp. SKB1291214]|uniref:dihydrolipoyl dehydrogenase n=1 Tax=Bdellovibrio sp. SKB1291214 TaxID=1732569 RepID=UPI000B51CE05|nr:dihydrolipoyl dehydrogenase [Bdellovibrio sp. SKB1291214]UYL09023.1 dihydrolipoyl dehydrogenase [Bdellovibrio sp. SKB1291214]